MKQLAAYAYRKVSGSQTSAQVEFRNVRLGSSADSAPIEGKKYSYDGMGNITMISQSTGSYYPLISYEYDSQNQLIKETYYDGEGTGSAHVTDTYEYTYDTAGNILSEKKNGTVTKTYTYGDSQWKDLLTAYNGKEFVYEGQTYDYINKTVNGTAKSGNPTGYYNDNYYYFMEWKNGSQLSYMSVETGIDRFQTAYDYDADGVRCSKYVENDEYYYITQNGKVVRETIKSGNSVKVLDFIYDESGRPFALKYSTNGGRSFTTYYYVLNLQGDVVKLVEILADDTGVWSYGEIANYEYEAWGKVLSVTDERGDAITDSTHLAHLNPLRYRGYYYDRETGFYYLQSRYYDPATHRFINADSFASTGQGFTGTNMFAYCNNNPVMRVDYTGDFSILQELIECARQIAEELEGYIIKQEAKGVGEKRLGLSTVSHSGCGVVAAYNALARMGSGKSFDDVLSYFNSEADLLLFGIAGMMPSQVVGYFRHLGYTVKETDDVTKLDLYAQDASACILWYVYESSLFPFIGGHFIEVHKVGNQYEAYNTAAECGISNFDSLVEYGYRGDRIYAIGIFIYDPLEGVLP